MEDARVRSALILALPALRDKKFLKEIKSALKDSDPEVRIAAVRSLVVLKDAETLGEESPVLRDPVERVRAESARILGANASEKIVKKFRALIEDEEESPIVRIAAVQGLGHSPHAASLEILASLLEQTHDDTPFREALLQALALKSDRKELKALIEIFKDATPRLREDLTHSFRLMGDAGAVAMKDLLQEDIPSLKPFIIEVLDKSGSIESHIRLLRHRDPAIRRDAARFLSAVSSLASFRGLVMAAQDPDEEVRILVIKALERLETEDSGVLLNELMKDPDRRVRKYTHWAVERLKVKSK
jgi:HEAT repeat protein